MRCVLQLCSHHNGRGTDGLCEAERREAHPQVGLLSLCHWSAPPAVTKALLVSAAQCSVTMGSGLIMRWL